ncbi:Leishmanolysin-like peptidase [Caenorhabditis elegans]|uniref:Leishmanolysin-like peptidase n=1 Tax=Caenorhabditis elegans TaxID=6239 RepID=Q7Z1J4_CAEEL|nr:Leishmanolysin-like peptidase [Caenorhabditis elegans]CAD92401.1 Leishmanolysin-like peptidase [Caenorhabditis elegans]|eukprot:NP_001022871.1 Leishmanolysin-like peptidase [Caenorhabditis elegans]
MKPRLIFIFFACYFLNFLPFSNQLPCSYQNPRIEDILLEVPIEHEHPHRHRRGLPSSDPTSPPVEKI